MRFNQSNNNTGDVNNAISEGGNVVQKTASDNAGANTNSRGAGGSASCEEGFFRFKVRGLGFLTVLS